ncbi:MAG TPA: type II secretion system protein GspG [Kofleriaceae bacterium]|jgi:hypothetical protein
MMWKLITVALFLGACGNPASDAFNPDQVKSATIDAKKYAYEAYPSWAAAHPEKACPTSLADLNEYVSRKDTKDPWGHDFKMMCGATVPAGAKGLAVLSFGPDGKEGTADDIKSW